MSEDGPKNGGRRRFLKSLPKWFLSLWGVGFVGVIVSYLRSPLPTHSTGFSAVRAGSADTLAPGAARLVRHGDNPLYVVRLVNGEIVALSALCTHYRCILNWNSETGVFVCPCHDGVFNPTGEVVSGIPTKDLETFPADVRLGEILVHLPGGL